MKFITPLLLLIAFTPTPSFGQTVDSISIAISLKDHLFNDNIGKRYIKSSLLKESTLRHSSIIKVLKDEGLNFTISRFNKYAKRNDFVRKNKRTGQMVLIPDLSKGYIITIYKANILWDINKNKILEQLKRVDIVQDVNIIEEKYFNYDAPTDPMYANPYTGSFYSYDYEAFWLRLCGFDKVWRFTTGSGILIGLPDQFGTDSYAEHEELRSVANGGPMWNNYHSNLNGRYKTSSFDAHGIQTGSMMVASNNGLGFVGAAYGARVIPTNGATLGVAEFASLPSDSLPDVINMSFNATDFQIFKDHIQSLLIQGVVLVAASGNAISTSQNAFSPAPAKYSFPSLGKVISVGATAYQRGGSFNGTSFSFSKNDNLPEFRFDGDLRDFTYQANPDWPQAQLWNFSTGSNPETDPENAFIDISAPGISVTTARGNASNAYADNWGTSFASPLVASAAALMLSVNPNLTPPEVYDILTSTAVRSTLSLKSGVTEYNHSDGERVWDPYYGYGRLDALEAVLASIPELPAQITSSTTLDQPFYRITQSTIIQYGNTVNVNAGVTFVLDDNASIVVKNGGRINVNGTQANPVRFINAREGELFYGISLQSGQNTINWAVFDGGEKMLEIASTNNTINNSRFKNGWRNVSSLRNISGTGNSQAHFYKCVFEDATSVGIVAYQSNMSFNDCEIKNSAQAGLWVSSGNINPTKNLYIHSNGTVQTYRDGIELMSGSVYLYGTGAGQGNNKIQYNSGDQIYVSSGSMYMGEKVLVGYETCGSSFCIPLVPIYINNGGFNTIRTNSSNRLVTNYSSNFIMAHNNYWGGTPTSSKFYGSIDYSNFLYWDPASGAGPQSHEVPHKRIQNEDEGDMSSEERLSLIQGAFDFYIENIERITISDIRALMGAVMSYNPDEFPKLYSDARTFLNNLTSLTAKERGQNTLAFKELKDEIETDLLHRQGKYESMMNLINASRSQNPTAFAHSTKRKSKYLDGLVYLGKYDEAKSLIADLKQEMVARGEAPEKVNAMYDIHLYNIDSQKHITTPDAVAAKPIDNKATENVEQELDVKVSPNPFNPTTNITFRLNKSATVRLTVHDMLGRQVGNLAQGTLQEGRHIRTFNAMNLATGTYVYRLQVDGSKMITGKLTLIK